MYTVVILGDTTRRLDVNTLLCVSGKVEKNLRHFGSTSANLTPISC